MKIQDIPTKRVMELLDKVFKENDENDICVNIYFTSADEEKMDNLNEIMFDAKSFSKSEVLANQNSSFFAKKNG